MSERCVACGEAAWAIGVVYGHPTHTVWFCPSCLPEEFKMAVRELPIHTPEHLRRSWVALHDPKCPYAREQQERAERRMHARAKEYGFKLPKMEER